MITAADQLLSLPTGSSPLTPSNDNLLFHPATSVFDQGGWVAYPTGFPSSLAFLDACGSFTGFSGCAVIYSDPHAIDGYIHPATFSVTPTPLPAAPTVRHRPRCARFVWLAQEAESRRCSRSRLIICTRRNSSGSGLVGRGGTIHEEIIIMLALLGGAVFSKLREAKCGQLPKRPTLKTGSQESSPPHRPAGKYLCGVYQERSNVRLFSRRR